MPAAGIHLSAATLVGIDFNKNEDIWLMADILKEKTDSGQAYSKLEKSYGLKYNPHGLLFNIALRAIHRPIDHYLRDWMHILVSGGTANAQTHALGKTMKKHKLPTSLIQQYSTEYTLPSKYGKVSPEWTAPSTIRRQGCFVFRITYADVGADHRGVLG